jgi:oligopeptidase B
MPRLRSLVAVSLVAGLTPFVLRAAGPAPAPPMAKKQPHLTQIHGETLVDDYYWMRNKGTKEVEDHLHAELAHAQQFMKPTEPLQQRLYDEMLARIKQTDIGVPYRDRGYYYYSRTEAGKQYPIYCRKKGSLDAPEEVVLDQNLLAQGKQFMSVGAMEISPDGQHLAYTTDDTGFRQYTLQVKDLRSGAVGPSIAQRVTSVEWTEDGASLIYGVEHPQTKRSFQVFRHRIGGPGPDDRVFEEADERFSVYVGKSRDRKVIFIGADSATTSEWRYLPADGSSLAPVVIAPRVQDQEYDVDHRDGTFWIRVNDTGRNFRLVTAPVASPDRPNWKEVVAHRDTVMLGSVSMFRDFHVIGEREGGQPYVRITDLRTGTTHRVEFPEPAYTVYLSNNPEMDATRLRLAYQSPVTSATVYDYDPATRERTLLKQVEVLGGYDASKYRVELLSATAADGVKVPLWVLSRRDLPRTGANPALLYGYGSYGISMSAAFDANRFSLVDRGFVYAVAYIRGGGELGKTWHDQGRMMAKMNTFTDFIAAAEHLVKEKYTSPAHLAIEGGSAGGLLMGAVTNMRPDLFKVVLSHVPFVDVINTMLDETLPLTVSEFEEWGNPKIAEQYRYMKSYSPYDNLSAKAYPTMLVKTSYNDSQVMYWEPAKYVAKLRALKTDANPLVFHVNMDPAGHGGKSGRYERLRETAFDYAFLLWQLGVDR